MEEELKNSDKTPNRPGGRGGLLKSGNPGNKGGRPPKGLSITELMRDILKRKNNKLAKDLALSIIEKAIAGNSTALKEVLGRIDGPVELVPELPGGDPQTNEEFDEDLILIAADYIREQRQSEQRLNY